MNLLGHSRRQRRASSRINQRNLQTSETRQRVNHHGAHSNGLLLMVLEKTVYSTNVRLHAASRDGVERSQVCDVPHDLRSGDAKRRNALEAAEVEEVAELTEITIIRVLLF